MPGETKIFKDTNGWFNVEKPGVYHPSREAARAARKATITGTSATTSAPVAPTPKPASSLPDGAGPLALAGLQSRLYDRLTKRQGVAAEDAVSVITSFGYNAAASYGHMREAGASHVEALVVISLGSPVISVTYGEARFNGLDHADALVEAMQANDGSPYADDDD